ncbi:MAG: hypothetical protein KGH60_02655 [Candidatus Micrarchaeota archaeon]|nr:hypothetical protein [Candidatus Micrarchaeota archaeon]
MIGLKVLFVCRANSRRSQAAAGIFNSISTKHTAMSAGLEVALEEREGLPIKQDNIDIMRSMGYDISGGVRKQLTKSMIDEADQVVWMLEKEKVPRYLSNSGKLVFMEVENPSDMNEVMRRDNILQVERKVKEFAASLEG